MSLILFFCCESELMTSHLLQKKLIICKYMYCTSKPAFLAVCTVHFNRALLQAQSTNRLSPLDHMCSCNAFITLSACRASVSWVEGSGTINISFIWLDAACLCSLTFRIAGLQLCSCSINCDLTSSAESIETQYCFGCIDCFWSCAGKTLWWSSENTRHMILNVTDQLNPSSFYELYECKVH